MFDFDEFVDRTGTGSTKWATRAPAVKQAGMVPLSVADMEFRCPVPVREAIRRAADHGVYGYTYADDAYHDALAGFMKRRHGCDIEKDWVLVVNGVVSALGVAVRALSEPGDAVIIQPPVYAPFLDAIEANGRQPVFNRLLLTDGGCEINFPEFEHLCTDKKVKLFILCSPHNPVGRVWTRRELERLADICAEHGVVILSDEIHADIILPGHRHTSILAIPQASFNSAVLMAMSKSFNLAGLACSEAIVPNAELRGKIARQQAMDHAFGMTYFARAASIAAHTECDGWLDALNAYIAENFAFMRGFLGERLPMFRLSKLEGTYLAWMDMRSLNMEDGALKAFLANEAKLALTMGDWFGQGGSGFTRWNIALPRPLLADALERLAAAVDGLGERNVP
ncbi:MAG TPA: MalY/PatB family protein [Clostridia bacterium]|nr:MalY/PatB family protein [Clostridia bacterium]